VRVLQTTPAPTVGLDGDGFDAWLAAKSRNFRQQMRRMRRQLDAAGARFRRIAAPGELVERLPHMTALHRQRMATKGERSRVTPAVERMLREAAERLAPAGRMWIWEAQGPDGAAISSHLFVAAGGEVGYWLGGFDDAWAAHKPGLVALVVAVEDGFSRGDRRLDLGPGGQHYKRRLADDADQLIEATLLPRTRRYPLARARLAPHELRRRVAIRMSPRRRHALRRLLRRPPPGVW
jgi:CelD/BcsL family acetyltransferase involved in cellulose biosynthesis